LEIDMPSLAPAAPRLSRKERWDAWLNLLFVDFSIIRAAFWNLHEIVPGVWRAAQPMPHHLRWAKRHGIKTIVNLRGRRDNCGSYIMEREACREVGLTLVDFPIRSRQPLERPTLLAALELFDKLEYPILIHCKSGADRAGFMSTLYMYLKGGQTLRQAMKKQLSLRYGHLKQAKTGVIDYFFERYLADNEKSPISLRDWVSTVYDRAALQKDFRQSWVAGLVIDYILRRE
jgi:protein tyrosine/serine phosphatase